MPIDTTQISGVQITDTFSQFKTKVNEIINIVNGLPASLFGGIGRLGGTIDGLSSGTPLSGVDGNLYIINSGGLAIGDYLGATEPSVLSGDISIIQSSTSASINVTSTGTANYSNLSLQSATTAGGSIQFREDFNNGMVIHYDGVDVTGSAGKLNINKLVSGTETNQYSFDANGMFTSESQLHVGGPLEFGGILSRQPNAVAQFVGSDLGTSLNDTVNLWSSGARSSHQDALVHSMSRSLYAGPTDWKNVLHKIQRQVDATKMGYIGFGNKSDAEGSTFRGNVISFGSGSSEFMVIGASGAVRVTADPADKVVATFEHLNTSGAADHGIVRIKPGYSAYGSAFLGSVTDSFRLHYNSASDDTALTEIAQNNPAICIKGPNRVGINTFNPLAELHVHGDLRLQDPDGEGAPVRIQYGAQDTIIQLGSAPGSSSGRNNTLSLKTHSSATDFHAVSAFDGGQAAITIGGNHDVDTRIKASGVAAGDKIAVFVEGSSGLVGVGTSSPTKTLDVDGNMQLTGGFYDSSGDVGTSSQVLSSTGSGTNWVGLASISGGVSSGTDTPGTLTKWSATDTITDSIITESGSTITIGGDLTIASGDNLLLQGGGTLTVGTGTTTLGGDLGVTGLTTLADATISGTLNDGSGVGTDGQVLTSTGSDAAWEDVPTGIPASGLDVIPETYADGSSADDSFTDNFVVLTSKILESSNPGGSGSTGVSFSPHNVTAHTFSRPPKIIQHYYRFRLDTITTTTGRRGDGGGAAALPRVREAGISDGDMFLADAGWNRGGGENPSGIYFMANNSHLVHGYKPPSGTFGDDGIDAFSWPSMIDGSAVDGSGGTISPGTFHPFSTNSGDFRRNFGYDISPSTDSSSYIDLVTYAWF